RFAYFRQHIRRSPGGWCDGRTRNIMDGLSAIPWPFHVGGAGCGLTSNVFRAARRPVGRPWPKGVSFMVNRNLLRQFDLPENELHQELENVFHDESSQIGVDDWLKLDERPVFETNRIVTGRVVNIVGDD